ncbi:hypothetical protein VTK73DRAFT_130 [Phialemonium thermophilum]|uniref:Uncharacterized protein n=1 Tax=Phialemonium thermophilum TaxID=223376 RepID=A0ABR3Y543_9PEZI
MKKIQNPDVLESDPARNWTEKGKAMTPGESREPRVYDGKTGWPSLAFPIPQLNSIAQFQDQPQEAVGTHIRPIVCPCRKIAFGTVPSLRRIISQCLLR